MVVQMWKHKLQVFESPEHTSGEDGDLWLHEAQLYHLLAVSVNLSFFT